MKNKITVLTLGAMLFALCFSAQAQQPKKIPRIGYVSVSGDAKNPGRFVEAFRQGLRDIGYIEGKSIAVEYRYPGSQPELVPGFVAELVQLKVDILVTSSTAALRAAKQATKTIPIVMVTSQDPVATGMVELGAAGCKYHWSHETYPRAKWETAGTVQGSRPPDLTRRNSRGNRIE